MEDSKYTENSGKEVLTVGEESYSVSGEEARTNTVVSD